MGGAVLFLGLLASKRHCTPFWQNESRQVWPARRLLECKICLIWGIEKGQNTEEDVSGGIASNSAFYKEHGHVFRPSFAVSPLRDFLCPIRNTYRGRFLGSRHGPAVSSAHDQEISLTTADQLIEEAGRAKSDGQPAVAYALLHQVVRIAPDNSLARWQLGQVKVDNEWLSVEEAQRRAEADPRQAKYQERKATLGESPQGQLALARWCRGNKLEDEAQFHWSSVLSADPNNKEALRAAGTALARRRAENRRPDSRGEE